MQKENYIGNFEYIDDNRAGKFIVPALRCIRLGSTFPTGAIFPVEIHKFAFLFPQQADLQSFRKHFPLICW